MEEDLIRSVTENSVPHSFDFHVECEKNIKKQPTSDNRRRLLHFAKKANSDLSFFSADVTAKKRLDESNKAVDDCKYINVFKIKIEDKVQNLLHSSFTPFKKNKMIFAL